MARHRINKDGHMIWFNSDEEYYDYLYKKQQIQEQYENKLRKKRLLKYKILLTLIIPIALFVFFLYLFGKNEILIVGLLAFILPIASVFAIWKYIK